MRIEKTILKAFSKVVSKKDFSSGKGSKFSSILCFDFEKNKPIRLVWTNGYALLLFKTIDNYGGELEGNYTINYDALNMLVKANGGKGSVKIEDNKIVDDSGMSYPLSLGGYVDYIKIIPNSLGADSQEQIFNINIVSPLATALSIYYGDSVAIVPKSTSIQGTMALIPSQDKPAHLVGLFSSLSSVLIPKGPFFSQ